jgi:hypothetical protein
MRVMIGSALICMQAEKTGRKISNDDGMIDWHTIILARIV